MKKRILSFVLVLVMTLGFLPTISIANAETYGDLTYEISDGEVKITDCDESVTTVDIPATIEGYPVTSIGDYAFYYCSSLTSVTIPDSVTSIGEGAFWCCSRLTSVTIPDSVTSIGNEAFLGCSGLQDKNGFVILKNILFDYFGSDSIVNIPQGVTSIGYAAFYDCSSLTSVIIPDSVTSIGDYAFCWCESLELVTIPDSVTSIGYDAFKCCSSLTSVTIPGSVISIGSEAFLGCDSLTSIKIPDSVTSIGYAAFASCDGLQDTNGFVILKNILFDYFGGDSIVNIPQGVTSISSDAFSLCSSLTTVIIPQGVMSIGYEAFVGCSSLTTITIPDSVTSIGYAAFSLCSNLTTVNFGGSETDRAGIEILSDNNELRNATWVYNYGSTPEPEPTPTPTPDPETPATSGTCGDNLTWSFDVTTGTLTIDGTGEMNDFEYEYIIDGDSLQPWRDYEEDIKTVIIEDGVTSLGNAAFAECLNLENVTIPNSVTSIGDGAFLSCESLKTIVIPNGVTAINRMTFMDCSNLETVTIPNTVTDIGYYAFDGCSSLKNITIPDSVTSIADSAFDRCKGLMDSKGFIIVKNILFNYEGTESELIIPDSVKIISEWCFATVENIVSVTIPDSVTTIGAYAFSGCSSLTTVNYCGSESDRENIEIGTDNDPLLNATWVYNYGSTPEPTPTPHTHSYTNACDTTCDCGYTRTITHSFGEYVYNNDASEKVDGTKTRTCSVCGHKETVTATGTKWTASFTDIKTKDFYYKPTLWAVANNITTGTSKTTFSPNDACTRGQIVTFLWRAAGCPEPTTTNMPFTDVGNKAFYRKAVLWAVENGITSGTSKTTFSPNDPCTRGQIATFLWRAKGKPTPTSTNMPFNDVEQKGFYYKAVLWAVENKITSGTSKTTFAPNDSCTRGQIVTFLYRAYN